MDHSNKSMTGEIHSLLQLVLHYELYLHIVVYKVAF